MFIVENGKITNDKIFDIGESRVANFVFKFDTAFDDADKFQLDLGGNKYSLYGFTDAGCLRFTRCDLTEVITKAESSFSVSVLLNGTAILSDEITITAVVQGNIVLPAVTVTADAMLKDVTAINTNGAVVTGNIENAVITTDETNGLTINVSKGYLAQNESENFPASTITETETEVTVSRGFLNEDKSFTVGGGEEIQGVVFNNSPPKATTVQIIPETLTADLTDFSSMFKNCSKLTTIPTLDTSNGTDFSSMFYYCSNLTTIPVLDTSNGTDFSSMFYNCSKLTKIPQLDVSNSTNCQDMFYKCERLQTIPALNTSKVTKVGYMFYYCSNLTTIEGIDFSSVNHNITNTFYYNPKLTSVKVNGTIAKNIDFSGAKNLDAASCISIAQALVVNTGTLTITFNSTTYNNVLLETIMPNTQLSIKGYIVSNKGWAIKTA